MTEEEIMSILGADMKLWERAETKQTANGLVKSLFLPFGIGQVDVTLEGVNDAVGRRSAVQAFGEYIRSRVKEATDDDIITAKAQEHAARVREERSRELVLPRNDKQREAAVASSETVPAFDGLIDLGEGLSDRIAAIEFRIVACERQLAKDRRELKAYKAMQKVLEESEDVATDS